MSLTEKLKKEILILCNSFYPTEIITLLLRLIWEMLAANQKLRWR